MEFLLGTITGVAMTLIALFIAGTMNIEQRLKDKINEKVDEGTD